MKNIPGREYARLKGLKFSFTKKTRCLHAPGVRVYPPEGPRVCTCIYDSQEHGSILAVCESLFYVGQTE